MSYIFLLAFKNILRSKRRTILTITTLAFGVMLYVVISAMYAGLDKSSYDNLVEFDTGHIKIRKAGFDEENIYSNENIFTQNKKIINTLQQFDFITGVTERINYVAEIDNGYDLLPIVMTGFDTKSDSTVFSLERFIIEGKLDKKGAILGRELAIDMKLQVGDSFWATFRDMNGSFRSMESYVSAIIFSSDPFSNQGKIFLPLDLMRSNLNTTGTSEITIKTIDIEKSAEFASVIKTVLPDFQIKPWQEMATDFIKAMKMEKKINMVIVAIIMAMAMIGVINSILISIYEKRKEIGTLFAMGMIKEEIRNLFILEGFLIGVMGSIVGCIAGAFINIYMVNTGLDYSDLSNNDLQIGYGNEMITMMKSAWVFSDFIIIVFISIVTSTLASYLPAKKAMEMQPVECLRTI